MFPCWSAFCLLVWTGTCVLKSTWLSPLWRVRDHPCLCFFSHIDPRTAGSMGSGQRQYRHPCWNNFHHRQCEYIAVECTEICWHNRAHSYTNVVSHVKLSCKPLCRKEQVSLLSQRPVYRHCIVSVNRKRMPLQRRRKTCNISTSIAWLDAAVREVGLAELVETTPTRKETQRWHNHTPSIGHPMCPCVTR